MSKPKCATCKDDPRGVLGLNMYSPCPDCNDLPLNGFEKDRAVYDLIPFLEAEVRVRELRSLRADDRNKEGRI